MLAVPEEAHFDGKFDRIAVTTEFAAEEKKAEDIIVLDLQNLSPIADYFIICTARSNTQVQAVVDHIDEVLGKRGQNPARVEGYTVAEWVLMDYIDVIVHVFQPETRRYYDLERLWIDAPRVDIEELKGVLTGEGT